MAGGKVRESVGWRVGRYHPVLPSPLMQPPSTGRFVRPLTSRSRMPHIARRLLWCTTLGALGCDEPAALVGNACKPEVAFTVVATSPPEFRWTPACDVGTLYVITEFGSPMWQIDSKPQADLTPTNHIQSGVVYGTVPTTAQQFGDLAPLETGQTYRVALSVTDSEGEPTQVGEATFRAPGE